MPANHEPLPHRRGYDPPRRQFGLRPAFPFQQPNNHPPQPHHQVPNPPHGIRHAPPRHEIKRAVPQPRPQIVRPNAPREPFGDVRDDKYFNVSRRRLNIWHANLETIDSLRAAAVSTGDRVVMMACMVQMKRQLDDLKGEVEEKLKG